MRTLFCLSAILAAAATANAQGSVEAMVNYAATTPANGSPVYSSIFSEINGPVGWTFQPQDNIDVTALGAFDYLVPGRGGVDVGLWNASGALLASETITASSTAVDQSLYQSTSPVLLAAGQTYYVAAYSTTGTFSAVVVTPGSAPNGYATMSPEIQLGQVAYSANSGFVFPATLDGVAGDAIIAPNFEYAVVPEPSVWALLGAGALVFLRRRPADTI